MNKYKNMNELKRTVLSEGSQTTEYMIPFLKGETSVMESRSMVARD